MKKKLVFFLVIFFLVTGLFSTNVFAKKKTERKPYAQKISYKIKGSTLTISKGKKKVSKIKGIEKVKKIVVKNNVKKLPINYFKKCKRLKKLTVSPDLIFYKLQNDTQIYWSFPKVVNTVEFSSDKIKRSTFPYYFCSKYALSNKSTTLFVKKGLLYKKRNDLNGYQDIQIFGVPSETVNLDIAEGTTILDYRTFMYLSMTDKNSGKKNINSACKKIKKIVIPKSVNDSIVDYNSRWNKYFKKAEILYNGGGIFFVGTILDYLDGDYNKYAKCFGNRAKWINDFLVVDDMGLYYRGCEKVVNVPEGIYWFDYQKTFPSCDRDSYRMIRQINGNAYISEDDQEREKYFYNEDSIVLNQLNGNGKEYVYCKHYAGKTVTISCEKSGYLEIDRVVGSVQFYDENNKKIKINNKKAGKITLKEVKKDEKVKVVIPNDTSQNFIARLINPVIV